MVRVLADLPCTLTVKETMFKKLLSGLFWVLLLNVLIKPFWILGIEVGVQNAVGAEEYGLYVTLFNLAYIFNILLDIGVTNFNTRNIAQHPVLITKHLSGILGIKVVLLAFYLVATFTVGILEGYDSRQFTLLAFLSFNQFLNSLILYLRSNFEGLLLFRQDSVISILDRVVMIIICGSLLWLPNHPTFRIEYFVYAQTVAYIITAVVALWALISKVGFRGLRFSWPFAVVILRQSIPYALLVLLMASYNRIDPMLLDALAPHGRYQAGIYAGAFRLLDALTMIAYLVSVPLLPIFSKMTVCVTDSRHELSSTLRWVTSLMLVFSVTAAVVASGFGGQLMSLLYTSHVDEYTPVFRVLVFGIIPISVTYIYGTLLTAAGRLRQLNIMAAVTLVVNIVVNIICIPSMGAVGSAWASLVAQSFMALAQIVVALRIFNIHIEPRYIIKIILFTLSIVAIVAFAPLSDWWLHMILALSVAIVVALLLGLVDVKLMRKTLKER